MFALIMLSCSSFWHCEYKPVEIATFYTIEKCHKEQDRLTHEGITVHLLCEEKKP